MIIIKLIEQTIKSLFFLDSSEYTIKNNNLDYI